MDFAEFLETTVTKSGTGTWDVGLRDLRCWDVGCRDAGTQGRQDVRRGMLGRGTRSAGRGDWGRGFENVGTQRRGAYGTRGRDKQTTPDFFAEFVKYNFRCSRERYCMLESL